MRSKPFSVWGVTPPGLKAPAAREELLETAESPRAIVVPVTVPNTARRRDAR
jgi:hypothetical protein